MNVNTLGGTIGAYQAQMDRTNKPDAARQAAQTGAAKTPQAAAQTAQATGDKINVSFDGMLRTSAFASAMRAPDVRQEKVDAIKQSLDEGTYVIDNRKIATKLVQDEKAIFGSK